MTEKVEKVRVESVKKVEVKEEIKTEVVVENTKINVPEAFNKPKVQPRQSVIPAPVSSNSDFARNLDMFKRNSVAVNVKESIKAPKRESVLPDNLI